MDQVTEVLSKIRPDVDFTKSVNLIDDDHLDSLDIIRLVSELETVFNISISGNDIVPENFNTIESIQSLIERSSKK